METHLQIGVGDDCSEYPEYTELVEAIVSAAYDTGNPFDVPFELPGVWVPVLERPDPRYTRACSTKDAQCNWAPWYHCPLKAQILTQMIEVSVLAPLGTWS